MHSTEEIDLIPTGVLVDALAKRFDTFVVYGYRHNVKGEGYHSIYPYWRGNAHLVLGVLSDMSFRVSRCILQAERLANRNRPHEG